MPVMRFPQNSADDGMEFSSNMNLGDKFTVVMWVKHTTLRNVAAGTMNYLTQNLSTGVKSLNPIGDNTGDIELRVRRATSVSTYTSTGGPIQVNVWKIIAGVYDDTASAGSLMQLYVGSEQSPLTEVAYGTNTDGSGALNAELTTGRLANGQGSFSFHGLIAFVAGFAWKVSLKDLRDMQNNPWPFRTAAGAFWLPGMQGRLSCLDYSGHSLTLTPFVGGDAIGPWTVSDDVPAAIRRVQRRLAG